MNKTLLILLGVASVALAEDTTVTTRKTTTTTTTGTGTITEYAPQKTFIVKETTGPVTYRYGKTVTYVTKKGKTLSDDEVRTRIKVGIPVTVHYDNDGDTRVISRVEVDDD